MSPPDDAEVQAAFQKFLSEYLGPDDKRLGSYWFTMPGEIWRQGVAWARANGPDVADRLREMNPRDLLALMVAVLPDDAIEEAADRVRKARSARYA